MRRADVASLVVPEDTAHLFRRLSDYYIASRYPAELDKAAWTVNPSQVRQTYLLASREVSLASLSVFHTKLDTSKDKKAKSRAKIEIIKLEIFNQCEAKRSFISFFILHLTSTDRWFWSWLSRLWPSWQKALGFVQPHRVIAWQRKRFRDHWRGLSQHGKLG